MPKNSLIRFANMLIETKGYREEEYLNNLYMLILEICREEIDERLRTAKEDLVVNLTAYLNGRKFSSEVLEDEVRKMLNDALKH